MITADGPYGLPNRYSLTVDWGSRFLPPVSLDIAMIPVTCFIHSFAAAPTKRISVFLGLFAVFASGCSSLKIPELTVPPLPFSAPSSQPYMGAESGFDPKGDFSEQVYNGVREAKARNAVVLHIVGDSTPVRVLPLPESGQSVTVSTLLTQTLVTKKLGSIQATLYRPSPESITGMPLAVKMASDGKTVRPETDYALRAGDRLRVQKAASPAVQGLFQSLLGM